MRELALVACLSMLAGCETLSELTTKTSTAAIGSYASPELTPEESQKVARDMVRFLSRQFPYAKTTVRLDPIKSGFHSDLVHALAQQGFGVIENDQVPGAVFVRYAVTFMPGGVVVRMRFTGKEASRFYAVTSNGLSFRSSYAMRGVTK